jgi:hypothetical protein
MRPRPPYVPGFCGAQSPKNAEKTTYFSQIGKSGALYPPKTPCFQRFSYPKDIKGAKNKLRLLDQGGSTIREELHKGNELSRASAALTWLLAVTDSSTTI